MLVKAEHCSQASLQLISYQCSMHTWQLTSVSSSTANHIHTNNQTTLIPRSNSISHSAKQLSCMLWWQNPPPPQPPPFHLYSVLFLKSHSILCILSIQCALIWVKCSKEYPFLSAKYKCLNICLMNDILIWCKCLWLNYPSANVQLICKNWYRSFHKMVLKNHNQ